MTIHEDEVGHDHLLNHLRILEQLVDGLGDIEKVHMKLAVNDPELVVVALELGHGGGWRVAGVDGDGGVRNAARRLIKIKSHFAELLISLLHVPLIFASFPHWTRRVASRVLQRKQIGHRITATLQEGEPARRPLPAGGPSTAAYPRQRQRLYRCRVYSDFNRQHECRRRCQRQQSLLSRLESTCTHV